MPTSAPHPCGTPGCPELVRGRAHCPAHEKKRERQRGNFRERGYSYARWDGPSGLRLAQLRKQPLCEPCAAKTPPEVTPADTVDHRIAWQSGATEAERLQLRDDANNLVSMCSSCHGKKTARSDGSFGRRA